MDVDFMKILYFASVNVSGKAGDSMHVREFIHNISPYIDSITVISPTDTSHNMPNNVYLKSAKYLNVPNLKVITYSMSAFFVGFHSLLTSKYDVIYERHHTFGIGCILSKIFSIPSIVEVNGWTTNECRSKNKLYINVISKSESNTFSRATKIIVVTPNLKQLIKQECNIFEDKIVVIENGANVDEKDNL